MMLTYAYAKVPYQYFSVFGSFPLRKLNAAVKGMFAKGPFSLFGSHGQNLYTFVWKSCYLEIKVAMRPDHKLICSQGVCFENFIVYDDSPSIRIICSL